MGLIDFSSFKSRLLFSYGTLIVSLVLASSGLYIYYSGKQTEEFVVGAELPRRLEAAGKNANQFFDKARKLIAPVSRNVFIRNELGKASPDRQSIAAQLSEAKKGDSIIETFGFVIASSDTILNSDGELGKAEEASGLGWYAEFKKQNRRYDWSCENGCFLFREKVMDGEGLLGVAYLAIRTHKLTSFLENGREADRLHYVILDESNRVRATDLPKGSPGMRLQELDLFSETGDGQLLKTGSGRFQRAGETWLSHCLPVGVAGCSVLVTKSADVALDQADKGFLYNSLFGIVLMFVGLGIASAISKKFSGGLNKIL
ncbi:MAG: cache domain-containing protein, partial [Cytophagales bacterium]|nr:cache domain-containing protein [Cytophagales bacterium]